MIKTRVKLLMDRLEMLKKTLQQASMMRFGLSPLQVKAIIREVKSIAKELATIAKGLGAIQGGGSQANTLQANQAAE